MKCGKAPGIDGIPAEFFKNAPVESLNTLKQVFNDLWEGDGDLSGLRKSVIFPIYNLLFFIDFRAGFDNVDRGALFTKLSGMCISKWFLGIIWDFL